MNAISQVKVLLIAAACSLPLTSFAPTAYAEGKGEKAGKKVDEAADKTEDAARKAKHKVKKGVKEGAQKTEDAAR